MKAQQVTATLMAAILVIGVMSAIGISVNPVQQAAAQAVTITTSADSHDDTFFGGWLQVSIEDDSTDDDITDTIDVTVRVESADGDTSQEITIPDTTAGSQRFEFFVCHTDFADCATGPADPDTSAALTDDQIVEFGDGAGGDELGVTGLTLFDDATIVIEYSDESDVRISYDETEGDISTDRSSYGGDNTVRFHLVEQDGNLDPTDRDSMILNGTELADLFEIDGGEFAGDVEFTETGDNSGDFEAELALETADNNATDTLVYDEDTVRITYLDASDPQDIDGDSDLNPTGSTATSELTIDISNSDGRISEIGDVTLGSELKFTVTDNDRNIDSEEEDSVDNAIEITTEGGDSEVFDLTETDDNTGIFAPDSANDEIRISFCDDDDTNCPDTDNGIIEMTSDDMTGDITVTYIDPLDADDNEDVEFSETVELTIATPSIDLPETSGINDDFTVTITDGNLNDNPRVRDTYTLELSDDGPHLILRGGDSLESLVNVDVEIESTVATFDTVVSETLSETGVNTGVFTVTFDMADILDSTGVEVDDGDSVEFTINDLFDDQSHEASDELSIGKATTGVDFSRSALPIPPEDDSSIEQSNLGGTVFTTLTVTDSDANEDSGTEDILGFTFQEDADEGEPSFVVEIDASGSDLDEVIVCANATANPDCDTDEDFIGSTLFDILDGNLPSLSETSKTSGVFDDELEFVNGGLDTDEWQDLELTVTYIDADGDEEESGITFRANDGSVSTDAQQVTAGALISVTVQDEDLNLDDDTAEEFEGSTDTTVPYLVAIETDDDNLCDDTGACPTTETFRETGTDTGIFVATYRVGEDIPVTDQEEGDDEVTQASLIRVTYNDEIDSSGGSGEEIELELPIVLSTGSMIIQPELVGPGTEITVLIADADLNEDPSGTDDFDPQDVGIDPDSDDFFINFRSDRNEVGEASPEIEETGANTGVFTFTIELVTDEQACEDDDLSEAKFDAQGGSEPSVGACPGDLISVRYEDEQTATGSSTVVSQVIEVKAFDPEFVSDKEAYNVGDKVTISISDPDANRDPDIADSLRDIRVSSDTDRVGQELSALETGKNTGVFRLTFQTSATSTGGAVIVKSGDDITIEYTDDYPADFEEEENDKDFTFTVPVGAAGEGGTGSTTPTAPSVTTPTGQPVDEVRVGQQVVLTTTVQNNIDDTLPFVAIVEVRDDSGVTVYLAWQTGTLSADGRAQVGLSWTPDVSGDYDIRTFVISDLNNPRILSDVKTTSISVS